MSVILFPPRYKINPLQPSVAFHIETNQLICKTNQLTGFYMKYNTGLRWSNQFRSLMISSCCRVIKNIEIKGNIGKVDL